MNEENINWEEILKESISKVKEKYPTIEIWPRQSGKTHGLGIGLSAGKVTVCVNSPVIAQGDLVPTEEMWQVAYKFVVEELICAGIIKTLFNPGL